MRDSVWVPENIFKRIKKNKTEMINTLHHNKSLWILAFFTSLLFVSCLKDEEIQDIDIDFPEPVELKTLKLVGQVLNDEGMPASGAHVEIVSHFLSLPLSSTTNEDGYYFFSEFINRGEDVLLLIDHADHFKGMYSQRILDQENPVVAISQLSKANTGASFSPENGISVNVDNMLQLDIEPNSFESHVGEIQLTAKIISDQDPANYLRGINGRGFLSSSIEFVNVSPQFTILIEFTDEFGGHPDLLKDAQFTLNVDNVDWIENYISVEAYHLQFSGFNYWLESGSTEVTGNEISGSINKTGIWTIGGRVDKHLALKGKLTTDDGLMPLEGKVKMMTEDGSFMRQIRTGSNGAFQFDDVQPGRSFVLEFFNSCDEEIHSYGPISLFESTDLGKINVQDVPITELLVDARDCEDHLGDASLLRVTSSSGKSFFRLLSEDVSALTIPTCGDQKAELTFLDSEGNAVYGPEDLN
ncbi:MAG: carboxypeptidase regulatory-like domain-containing protein, partial [Saprospirales bacterium]